MNRQWWSWGQAKRAPRAAFPSGCLAAQTKRWAEVPYWPQLHHCLFIRASTQAYLEKRLGADFYKVPRKTSQIIIQGSKMISRDPDSF